MTSSQGSIEAPESEEATTTSNGGQRYLKLAILAVIIGLTVALFLFRDQVQDLDSLGYLGAFIANLASSATIIVPVPGIAVVFILGDIWNPLFIGLVSGAGSALGELTGYAAGYSGRSLFQGNRLYPKITGWVERRGSLLIFIFALIPNPLFDLVGIAAGALRYPVWKFLFFCLLGKIPRCILIAYAGHWGLEWVRSWFAS
ncbi:VTT domain-containing protein [Chloroflexota bacterium]